MHVDEMTNEDLSLKGHSEHILRGELDRVEGVIKRHTLTGDDLSYWFDRSKIIRTLLHENSRNPNL